MKLIVKLIVSFVICGCWCDDLFEIDQLEIPRIVESRGFTCETHYITTSDGYILGNYRIVNPLVSKSSQQLKPILIQSGFIASSVDFIINSPRGFLDEKIFNNRNNLDSIDFDLDGRNLGFILANLGYDVWLINPRGNHYSTNHTTLDPKSDKYKFWSFSMDEIANLDLPEIIDYVLKRTGQATIGYIGYSRGSLVMFGLLADRPEYNEKVKPFISLAPAVYLNSYRSPIRLLALKGLIYNHIRDHPNVCFKHFSQLPICDNFILKHFCDIISSTFIKAGTNYGNLTRMRIFSAHFPSGSSCWDIIHFSQRMAYDDFCHIDLGVDQNLNRYGTKYAPVYNLQNINNQHIVIINSVGDEIVNPNDVQKLIHQLKVPNIERITIDDAKFLHRDFIVGNNVGHLINKPIAKVLAGY